MKETVKALLGRILPSDRSAAQPHRRQFGFVLVEALIAVAILGTATAATVTALSTSTITTSRSATQGTASWIATSQAESVSRAVYVPVPGQYDPVATPDGYSVTAVAVDFPGGNSAIQTVVITVSRGGTDVLTTEIVKVNR